MQERRQGRSHAPFEWRRSRGERVEFVSFPAGLMLVIFYTLVLTACLLVPSRVYIRLDRRAAADG